MWISGGYSKIIKDLLFPDFCISCGKPGFKLCENCENKLDKLDFPSCLVCDNLCINGKTHAACMRKYTPKQLISPFAYSKAAKKIILKSKYGPKSYKLLDILINSNHNKAQLKYLQKVDIIVPAPMTKKLFEGRLINHALYISEKLSTLLKVPISDVLMKLGGKHQKSGSRSIRIAGIKGAITMRTNEIAKLQGKNVLIVDDVTTTGATLIECSKVLLKNGAKSTYCYTLAKDLKYSQY